MAESIADTPLPRPVHSVPNESGAVALTMDLCSCPACTRRFEQQYYGAIKRADVYAKNHGQNGGVHITAFVSGDYYRQTLADGKTSGRDVIERLILDGQEIGAHGKSHLPRGMIKPDDTQTLNQEFSDPQAEYAKTLEDMVNKKLLNQNPDGTYVNPTTGAQVPSVLHVDRAPWGSSTIESMKAAAAHGLTTINWNKDGDEKKNESGIFKTMMAGAKAGDIILTHGNGNGHHEGEQNEKDTFEALKAAIDKQHLHFTTVSALLKSGTPKLAQHPLAREDLDRAGGLTDAELSQMAGQYIKARNIPESNGLRENLIATYKQQREKTAADLASKPVTSVDLAPTSAPAPAPLAAARLYADNPPEKPAEPATTATPTVAEFPKPIAPHSRSHHHIHHPFHHHHAHPHHHIRHHGVRRYDLRTALTYDHFTVAEAPQAETPETSAVSRLNGRQYGYSYFS